jgi:hypothetical protein
VAVLLSEGVTKVAVLPLGRCAFPAIGTIPLPLVSSWFPWFPWQLEAKTLLTNWKKEI